MIFDLLFSWITSIGFDQFFLLFLLIRTSLQRIFTTLVPPSSRESQKTVVSLPLGTMRPEGTPVHRGKYSPVSPV